MKKVYQLVHTLSYGDAISGEVLAMRRALRSQGFESEIYSINCHPKYQGETKDYRNLPSDFDGDLVLHYSIGSPLNKVYLTANAAKRTMIYHNITPADWFKRVNHRVANDIEAGISELPDICRASARIISDSSFNAAEIQNLGFASEVLAIPFDPERWNLEANQGIANQIQAKGGIHVMHVGRLAPNKCIEDIIKTFYFLHHKIEKNSTLWLSGIDIDTELYSYSLKRLVDELGLNESVKFVGQFADNELKALYQNASVYLCMSEHEGYCVPAIEAMYFGVPTIATAAGALPETIGNGGIIVSEKRHSEIALLIDKICKDSQFRNNLITAGKQRVEFASFDNFIKNLAKFF